jgi:hypothetical protein
MPILNAGSFSSPGNIFADSGYSSNAWFDIEFQAQPARVVSQGSNTDSVVRDLNFSIANSTVLAFDVLAVPIIYSRKETPIINYQITSGGNLTQDSIYPNLFKSQINGGVETVTVSSLQRTITKQLPSSVYSTNSTPIFTGYVNTSLAYHISSAIDSRLVGKNPMDNGSLFVAGANLTTAASRNPNFWGADLVAEFTGISPFNTGSGLSLCALPITKRHLSFAKHTGGAFPLGTIFNFVNVDGSFIQRTLIQRKDISNSDGISVGLLDSDLPNWTTIYPILPSNFRSYLPNIASAYDQSTLYKVPVFNTNQSEGTEIRDLIFALTAAKYCHFEIPTNIKRVEFYKIVESGMSGNPLFVIINNKLVLVSQFKTGLAGGGTCLADFRTELNQLIVDVDVMQGISTGYTVSVVDLSGFPSY